MTQGEVIGLIKAFGGSSGGGGGSAVTVLECTKSDGVYTVPMKAGELYAAFKSGIIILKFTDVIEPGDPEYEYTAEYNYIVHGAEYDTGNQTGYNFTTYAVYPYAETADDYPTFTHA